MNKAEFVAIAYATAIVAVLQKTPSSVPEFKVR
jgi:hypothetical protein